MDGTFWCIKAEARPVKQDHGGAAIMEDCIQSVYSNTCTTLFTPATVRTMFTTASASWWLTRPIK